MLRARLAPLLFALAVVYNFVHGCDNRTVATYDQWCDYVHDPAALEHRYDVFTFKKDSVVDGVAAAWDRIIVENSAKGLGVHPQEIATDTLIRKLRTDHLMGAFRVGDTLHFILVFVPSSVTVPGQSQAQTMADEYERRMVAARDTSAPRTMEHGMYCLYEGLNVFFARIDIQESDSRASIQNYLYEKLKAYH
jgi:hypothetical protein